VRKQAMVLVALFGFAAATQVRTEQPKPVFGEKIAPAELPQLIEMIRSQIEPGGRWEYVPKKERPTLEAKLDEMQRILAGRASLDELSNDERIRLINAQEHVNAILTRHDGERLICKRETPTGSHRPVNNCVTFADRKRDQEASRRFLDDAQQANRGMPKPAGAQ
jgi:hypothetical protein